MKTAVSLPDDLFTHADQLARRLSISRSQLYAVALSDFVRRHRRDAVTEKLNAVYSRESSSIDQIFRRMQAVSIPKEEW